jgi:hypothetical protein
MAGDWSLFETGTGVSNRARSGGFVGSTGRSPLRDSRTLCLSDEYDFEDHDPIDVAADDPPVAALFDSYR